MKKASLPLFIGFICITFGNASKAPKINEDKITSATKSLSVQKPKAQKKLLIFSVTNGYRHKSIPLGNRTLEIMGEQTGAFEAIVSNDLSHFEPENIDQLDGICFLNTTQEVFSPNKRLAKELSDEEKKTWAEREGRLKESLMNFIKSGKGFIGIHSATDTFYEWPEYGEMIGGYFDGHPWTHKTEVSISPERGEEAHFTVSHLEGNLEFQEEIYQFKDPYDARKLDIVLRLDPHRNNFKKGKRTDQDYPVSWLKSHGKGSVFYSSLGHNDHIFYNPDVLQHFLSGIQWALGDLESPEKE